MCTHTKPLIGVDHLAPRGVIQFYGNSRWRRNCSLACLCVNAHCPLMNSCQNVHPWRNTVRGWKLRGLVVQCQSALFPSIIIQSHICVTVTDLFSSHGIPPSPSQICLPLLYRWLASDSHLSHHLQAPFVPSLFLFFCFFFAPKLLELCRLCVLPSCICRGVLQITAGVFVWEVLTLKQHHCSWQTRKVLWFLVKL